MRPPANIHSRNHRVARISVRFGWLAWLLLFAMLSGCAKEKKIEIKQVKIGAADAQPAANVPAAASPAGAPGAGVPAGVGPTGSGADTSKSAAAASKPKRKK